MKITISGSQYKKLIAKEIAFDIIYLLYKNDKTYCVEDIMEVISSEYPNTENMIDKELK